MYFNNKYKCIYIKHNFLPKKYILYKKLNIYNSKTCKLQNTKKFVCIRMSKISPKIRK